MEKKEAAWYLYKEGILQKDIARTLGITEQTVVSWKKQGDWEKKLHDHQELFESNAQRVQKLIAYQLRTLERMVQDWEQEGSNRLIGKGEIDALSKLYATIKTKETTWTNYIRVCKELMEFVAGRNVGLAKQLTDQIDDFLNETRDSINGNQ
jgi:transposase